MNNRRFKQDLQMIYNGANEIVRELKKEGITELQRNFLVTDLLELTNELVVYNCRRFIQHYTITELTEEDLYAVAIGEALIQAIDFFDFNKGYNFMGIWRIFMERRFTNELNALCSEKEAFRIKNVCSANKELDDNGSTIHDLIGVEDFAEEVVSEMVLAKILNDFEKVDKHGKVIRCCLIKSQEIRTAEILKVLGAETYGQNERKKVSRVKEKFRNLLLKKGYNLQGYC